MARDLETQKEIKFLLKEVTRDMKSAKAVYKRLRMDVKRLKKQSACNHKWKRVFDIEGYVEDYYVDTCTKCGYERHL